jgi:hypothetical protein
MEPSSSSPVIVDFYADWCGPCKLVAPIFKQLAEEMPAVKFVKVDTDVHEDCAGEREEDEGERVGEQVDEGKGRCSFGSVCGWQRFAGCSLSTTIATTSPSFYTTCVCCSISSSSHCLFVFSPSHHFVQRNLTFKGYHCLACSSTGKW